jgi:hypothetical protein
VRGPSPSPEALVAGGYYCDYHLGAYDERRKRRLMTLAKESRRSDSEQAPYRLLSRLLRFFAVIGLRYLAVSAYLTHALVYQMYQCHSAVDRKSEILA